MSRHNVTARQFEEEFYKLRIVMERLGETYSRVSTTKKCQEIVET